MDHMHRSSNRNDLIESETSLDVLQKPLKVREEKFDQVYEWMINGGIKLIKLADVNNNANLEIGAISSTGGLAIYDLDRTYGKMLDFSDEVYCRKFYFFEYGNNGPDSTYSVFNTN